MSRDGDTDYAMSFFGFHPLIERWFHSRFAAPTEPQSQGWPLIADGEHTLIAAPTGSGKTLTAFLACIDRLLKCALANELPDENRIIYVSPLRALSNDMHRNLEVPLAEILAMAAEEGLTADVIRAGLRTGDTSSSKRTAMVRRPPHILVTTPESLYLMLTGPKSRETLCTCEAVIVDEIHALVRDKRGSHLALTLERLDSLCDSPPQRIGLSATQKPIERMADFLIGSRNSSNIQTAITTPQLSPPRSDLPVPRSNICRIVDIGHSRELDLAIEIPPSELGAVCMHEQWAEVNQRLVELVNQHRSTLIFVNTRRMAERVTHQLTELMGDEVIGSHHGALSSEIRLKTERQLKSGELKAVVATASLELGLDVGYLDLVIQLGSPRAIATLLQRIGRSGHSLGLVPKGRLFALTRDELLECMALIRAVRAGRLDVVQIPEAPLDVLAQQIVAETSCREWNSDELFELFRRSYPYRNLSREQFDRTVEYLSEGISRSTGRSRVYLHHDQVRRRLKARKGARISALTNGGAIPEVASYRVITDPEGAVVGSLDEEFAAESMAGDVFLLGNTSWRIQHVRGGDVTVTDAQGAPPTIPFWRGEAPGRTFELSEEVSRLREELETRIGQARNAERGVRSESSEADCLKAPRLLGTAGVLDSETDSVSGGCLTYDTFDLANWLTAQTSCCDLAAEQTIQYASAQKAAIGLLPTQKRVVFERFFDESGGMQLVVHAPFGAAINRAWGFAMRKRFCRSYDFELQATADDDGFILSLGPQHSFPIESLFPMLTRRNARGLLEQAILTVPMFQVRWRWNVTRALLVLRRNGGKRVPPALQRFRADDLLTAVFPRLTGCQEEHTGDIEMPDHPLLTQTMHDCLTEIIDIDGLERTLEQIERGEITLIARETREPSPFCYELLNANPYAFLDGGEFVDRRARAVSSRRSLSVESVDDLGKLDPQAIERVVREASPAIRDADELHDLLLSRIILPVGEADTDWTEWYEDLSTVGRATTLTLPNDCEAWVAAERLPAARAVFPDAAVHPPITPPPGVRTDWSSIDARIAIVRGLIDCAGPITADYVADRLSITGSQTEAALEALEGEGVVLRGHFTPNNYADPKETDDATETSALPPPRSALEWCHRRLLARIHRLTLQGLRQQIEPVGVEVFVRHLTGRHGLSAEDKKSGSNGLFEVISMLQGLDIPAVCWERDILPARLEKYKSEWLDELCLTGEIGWGRLFPPPRHPDKSPPMASLTRVAPLSVWLRTDLDWLTGANPQANDETLSSPAVQVLELLSERGAMFFADLLNETRMLPGHLRDVLGELVTRGVATADGFAGLRDLIAERGESSSSRGGRRRGVVRRRNSTGGAGRWSVVRSSTSEESCTDESPSPEERKTVEEWAWQLLRRWGVVFRDLLDRESGAPRWYELLQVYRRLEARGEIRGGRFITGVGGEQFALGETVRGLRALRDAGPKQELVFLSAADPLNLVGVLTDHPRIPRTASNRIAYLDGVPVAALQAGELRFFCEVAAELQMTIAERFGASVPSSLAVNAQMAQTDVPVPDASEDASPSTDKPNARKQRKQRRGIPRPMIS